MRTRKAWTEWEETLLLEMRAGGASWEEIANVLGRTRMSVEVRAAEIKRRAADTTSGAP